MSGVQTEDAGFEFESELTPPDEFDEVVDELAGQYLHGVVNVEFFGEKIPYQVTGRTPIEEDGKPRLKVFYRRVV